MKLTIGMIVKNEAKYLAMCLEGLKPILENVDSELIIVDTGSTDDTVAIAKRYTDKVFFHQWHNDFAEARNITIEKAQGEWYFYIDADEILEHPESIIEFFQNGMYKQYKSLAIKIVNLSQENPRKIGSTFYSKRIVKKDRKLKFISKIHEHLPEKVPAYVSRAIITHYGYINTDLAFVEEKANRNAEIIKQELKQDPENTFLLYYLGQTYNFNHEYKEALIPLKKAYELAKKSGTYPLNMYIMLLDSCIKTQLFAEVKKIAHEILAVNLEENSAYIIIYFFLAQAQAQLGEYKESIESYIKCLNLLKLYETDKLPIDLTTTVADFGGEKYVYSQIAAIYDILQDYEKSLDYSKKIIALTKNGDNAIEKDFYYQSCSQIVKLTVRYTHYDDLITFYEEIIKENDSIITARVVNTLESIIGNNKKQKEEIINRFAELEIETDYVFLNKIRKKKSLQQALIDDEAKRIYAFDFNDKIDTYGEFIYYLMMDGFQIDSVLNKLEEKEINRFNEYMVGTFGDFSKVVVEYFKKYDDVRDVHYTIFSKALKRVVLIKEEIDPVSYLELFKRYINEGVFYLENVYHENILDTENTFVLKNSEEAFFIYMRKALNYQESNQKEYLKYLRKALHAYEYMKKGIELLLEEVKSEEEKKELPNNAVGKEFEAYKVLVRNNIATLIKEQKIAEAKHLIDEYLSIVPDDLEMLTLKSEVQLKLM